jgi:hypothetical protein
VTRRTSEEEAAHKYRLAQAQKLIDLGTPKKPVERAKRSMRVYHQFVACAQTDSILC